MSDRPVTATYRLQLHGGFTFAHAQAVVPYLADLGISHLYLSPVLQAAPGSMHGYDVVDHSAVSSDIGGRHGIEELAASAHEHGLGLVVDVVPNHMAIPAPEHLNHPLWDVLARGRSSAYAHWFDIDWELCGGRIGLPLLGDTIEAAVAAGELKLDAAPSGEPVVRYHDHVFPVADGTEGDDVAAVLARQHYLLASWRDKDAVLGYRRFFDVDTLIAVRVEVDDVFDATHALLLDLYRAGVVDGFRVDHPDGLADPEGYLARLAAATEGGWVVVEKILEGDERLPASWATAGTTGYDALSVIQTALAPPTGARLDTIWRDLAGDDSLEQVEHAAKRQVVATLLTPEVERLTRRATELSGWPRRAGGPLEPDNSGWEVVREAFETLLSHVEVYRAYLRTGTPPEPVSLRQLDTMTVHAVAERPDLADVLHRLRDVLADVDSDDPRVQDLVVRFQQVCGPAMAKGVEDTTFYRFNRLLPLNEVGGDPGALDHPGPQRLHAWAAHQQSNFPLGMTTLTTHDTKRSEDVRARLLALAGDPDAWEGLWKDVAGLAGEHVVDGPTAYLLFQTLLGAWPIDEDRLTAYLVKAMREAKRHTTWIDPGESYESRVLALARDCLATPSLTQRIATTLADHEPAIAAATLGAKLLQLTLPGAPDVYQGCETVALSLVDPDNRRPVDHESLGRRLRRLDDEDLPGTDAIVAGPLADAKLRVTAQTLRLRRRRPALFGAEASYRPLPCSPELVAFARAHGGEAAVTVVRATGPTTGSAAGPVAGSAVDPATVWGDLTLPDGPWVDLFTGRGYAGGRQASSDVLAALPVALLVSGGRA